MEHEYRCPLDDKPLDLSPYCMRHSGDITEVYKTVRKEELRAAWYLPQPDAHNRYPGVILIHGGGWQGRKIFPDQATWSGDYLGFLGRYLAEQGILAVSIDYRMARDNAQTAGYQLTDLYGDCADAVRYIAGRGAAFGLDIDRVAVLGESAGGYLAAALLTFPYESLPIHFRAGVLVNAITALTGHWHKAVPHSTDCALLRALTDGERECALSPVRHIGADTPPVLLLHGDSDSCVPPQQSADFHRTMLEAGRPSELIWLPDTDHAFLLAEYTPQQAAARTAVRLIEKNLGRMLKER